MDDDDDDYSGVIDSSSEPCTTSIPAASNAILMLSLPDTPQEQENEVNDADHDVFETPPEYALVPTASQEQTPVLDLDRIYNDEESDPEELGDDEEVNDVVVAVGDLDRDTDLAESEAEIRVLKRDASPDEAESSPSKKSRVSEQDLGNSEEESETEPLSLSNHSSNSDQTLPIAGDDVKSVEQNSDSESDDAASEETQPVTEESGSPSGMEYSSQDGSDADSMDAQLCQVFPSADSDEMRAEGGKCSDLLDVLKLLTERSGSAGNEVNKCSFLEIAKCRGMTFPRL